MHNTQIPDLSADAVYASAQLTEFISEKIRENGGSIPFSQFMQLALYAPKRGYYTGGAHKIGVSGDFMTAPMLTPLFAQTLANQIKPLLMQTAANIYEFGAGTGVLAADLLNTLSGSLKNYYIIELSSELAERQQNYIQQHAPNFAHQVTWLDTLPEQFDGVLIGNEVLDAMPVERVRCAGNGQFERVCVAVENEQFIWQFKPLLDDDLFQAACKYLPKNVANYTSELHLTQYAFVRTLAEKLVRGAMIWIDYGFDSKQYYHEQRNDGTLIGHHRHHSIHDPFFRVGLTDLTAHVNFTDIAEAGVQAELDLIGYTTQANFLFNLGILDLLAAQFPQTDTPEYVKAAHAVQQLTAQHEMGELFKVIAFGRDVDVDWLGFSYGDLCHKL